MTAMYSALRAAKPHVHLAGEECPYCEMPIPNDRLEEVAKRIQAKDRARQADADAKIQVEVDQLRQQAQAQLDRVMADAANREVAARAEERKLAEASIEAKLAETRDAAKAAAERSATLESELAQSRTALTATVEQLKQDFIAKEEALRLEARTTVVRELGEKIENAENARAAAEAKANEIQAQQEQVVAARVAEAREALEQATIDAVNAERSKNFEDKLKLEGLVDQLQRKLQNKTAEELGDRAEVDLFEDLKAEFPDDEITRVGRGKAGADIIHKVRLNGVVCGCIVYDSKNHGQWRNDHATKLRADQMAEKADHAVLSTHSFPKDRRELHIDDSKVILVKPGRAVVVAMILRQHIVQLYTQKVSNDERGRKTDELYALMTSDRFQQFMLTITRTAEQLEALQVQERKAHESVWKKQGEFLRTIVRSCSQFDEEIGRIVGTAGADRTAA